VRRTPARPPPPHHRDYQQLPTTIGSACQSSWPGYGRLQRITSIQVQAIGTFRDSPPRPDCKWIFHQI
jgi:hypothetical protein